jgi:outer membrane protein OmpA-like peptidoglycan-associated protein
LKLTAGGFFTPEFVKALPDNFTIEFDVLTPPTFNGYAMVAAICELPSEGARNSHTSHNAAKLSISPGNGGEGQSGTELRQDGTSLQGNSKYTGQFTKTKNPVHISLWRQRQRLRVYWNEEKLWDLPKAFAPAPKLNGLVFVTNQTQDKSEFYLSNIRLAVGAPDTRNKLLTEGKWVTHGILFDVNSDRVKPESYGALKEIAGVLTENADVKIQVVGHTDSDGDDAKNLDLSKRRAASVRAVLAKEFAIAENRMETDGKGEGQPIDKNDTPAGKANNRRVEFIKK